MYGTHSPDEQHVRRRFWLDKSNWAEKADPGTAPVVIVSDASKTTSPAKTSGATHTGPKPLPVPENMQ